MEYFLYQQKWRIAYEKNGKTYPRADRDACGSDHSDRICGHASEYEGDPDEVHCSDRTGNAGPGRDRRSACMEYGW